MLKKMNLILIVIMMSSLSWAKERSYVEADGIFDLVCSQQVTDPEAPQSIFTLTNLVDENTPVDVFGASFGEALISLDGSSVYDITVQQYPFYGSEIFAVSQSVPGCELAPMSVELNQEGKMEIYFKCAADGDAGYGEVSINMETAEATGTFYFPEGQADLTYPIFEDTQIEVQCQVRL